MFKHAIQSLVRKRGMTTRTWSIPIVIIHPRRYVVQVSGDVAFPRAACSETLWTCSGITPRTALLNLSDPRTVLRVLVLATAGTTRTTEHRPHRHARSALDTAGASRQSIAALLTLLLLLRNRDGIRNARLERGMLMSSDGFDKYMNLQLTRYSSSDDSLFGSHHPLDTSFAVQPMTTS